MRDRLLIVIVVILYAAYIVYTFFITNQMGQNEEFFHSKMLLSVKDFPNGFHLVLEGERGPGQEVFGIYDINNLKEKAEFVGYSNVYFDPNFTDIFQLNTIYSGNDINIVSQSLGTKWQEISEFYSSDIKFENYTKVVGIDNQVKDIGTENFVIEGHAIYNGIPMSVIIFQFIKGPVYQAILIGGPSDRVSVNESIRLARIVANLTS